MNRDFKSRIKRVEEIAKAKGKSTVFIWGRPGESEGEAIKRMEAEGKDIIFIAWIEETKGEEKGPIDEL